MRPIRARRWLGTLWVGLRLSTVGGVAERGRLAVMAAGFAIAGALVLHALSLPTALARYDHRAARRSGIALQRVDRNLPAATLRWFLPTSFFGRPVDVYVLEGSPGSPVPPGIPRLPSPGEAFVSPALADALASPSGSLLRPRVPGRVVGVIGEPGLLEPDELIAYVGAAPDLKLRRRFAEQVTAFTPEGSSSAPLSPAALVLLSLAVLSVLLPLGLFIWTVSRVSAAVRELRLARIRLVGGTRQQARVVAAAEVLVPAIAGVLVASSTSDVTRSFALHAVSALIGHGFFEQDLVLPAPLTAATVIGIPLLAVVIALASLRRVNVSPLGVAHRTRSRQARAVWPLALTLGLLGLIACWAGREPLRRLPGGMSATLVGVPLASTLMGLAGTVPFLVRVAAGHLAARASSPSSLLGARRLEAGPSSAGRAAASLAALSGLAIVLEAIFASASARQMPPGVAALERADLVVSAVEVPPTQRRGFWLSVADVPGVLGIDISNITPSGARCGPRCVGVIHTDGDPATEERVRNVTDRIAHAESAEQVRADYVGWGSRAVRLLTFGGLFVVIVTAASLLTTAIDGVLERRRALAALHAIGAPGRVVARSLLWQAALPMGTALSLAIPMGSAVAALLFAFADQEVSLPWGPIGVTAAAAAALTLVVTALSLPWARSTADPSSLKAE